MFTIYKYSHFFKIQPKDDTQKEICRQFTIPLVQMGTVYQQGRYTQVPVKVFAAATKDRKEWRFHITLLESFLDTLRGKAISEDKIEIIEMGFEPSINPQVTHTIKPGWTPRPVQLPVLDYLLHQKVKANHLVTLSTGVGKSLCSMFAAAEMGKRVLYLLRPAFMDKWFDDLHKTYELTKEDIISVSGSYQLMGLLALAKNHPDKVPKIIILSNKTYQNYLKAYEKDGTAILEQGYACLPDEMYEHLGVGIRFIDEVHLDFHLNFKADLYTNTEHASAFSASLIDSQPFIVRMYNIAYPVIDRYKAPPPKKYIEARGVLYKTRDNLTPKISWAGRKEYSHGAYEQWILKSPTLTDNYLNMINDIVQGEYITNYREGDRLLIFCYSIEMATVLTEYFKEQYPDKTVERYVEEDAFANVMEPDIRISTVLSAGTGIDIKKLKVAILTTAISSEKSNIQALGRLRELENDDRAPVFFWLTNEKIDKHMRYHESKKQLFADRTLSIGERYYDKPI